MTLLLFLLFLGLALVLFSGDWRTGLLITVVIGFAQDPIRKLTPNQPGFYVGLVLLAFVFSTIVLFQRNRGRFELLLMFPTSPTVRRWLPLLVIFIFLQSVNSLLRWGIPARTLIGAAFYLAPLVALWVGFQLARNQLFIRKLLNLYIICTSIFAVTAVAHYLGFDIPLFKAVSGDKLITFRYGFSATGAIGLWRSTDIAAIHLTVASCFSLALGMASTGASRRPLYITLSILLALTSLLTGRRKAIVQIIVFILLFSSFVFVYGRTKSRQQLLAVLISTAGIAAFVAAFDPASLLGPDFDEYLIRASSAGQDLGHRFQYLGLKAFFTGLEISRYVGLGAGTLAQTGDSGVARIEGAGLIFVSESGLGKVAAELGLPGILLILIVVFGILRTVLSCLSLIQYLPSSVGLLQLGLLSFAVSNIPFFSAASGVYGDPFVLLLCGLSFGAFLAVPVLFLDLQAQTQFSQRSWQNV